MSNLTEAAAKVVEVLTEFDSETRLRIVRASLTLLGDELGGQVRPARDANGSRDNDDEDVGEFQGVHPLAQQWMRKNSVTAEQLEHYFHFDHGKFIPIELPGSATTKSQQTVNAYLAQGLAAYLATGDASFSDADGRKFCEKSGCYDNANHTKSVKLLKNKVSGSKTTGWKLTAPGLTAIAELIKQPKA